MKKSGFTLLELSIVLVIIGLIIGGVTAGSALIESSKINSQLSQIDKINAAALTFRLKYNSVPGDFNKAVEYDIQGPGFCNRGNGNGNGFIAVSDDPHPKIIQGEPLMALAQLSKSKILDIPVGDCTGPMGTDSYFIKSKIRDDLGIVLLSSLGKNGIYLGFNGGCDGTVKYGTGCKHISRYFDETTSARLYAIPTITAFRLDDKIDDGMPDRGKVRSAALTGSDHSLRVGAVSNPLCYTAGATSAQSDRIYDVTNNNGRCHLWFDADF